MTTKEILNQIAAQENHPWAASIIEAREKQKRLQKARQFIKKQLNK